MNVGNVETTRSISIWENKKKNMKNFLKQKATRIMQITFGRLSGTRRIYINHLLDGYNVMHM